MKDGLILEYSPETLRIHFGVPFKKWGENVIHA
jgi:hypothetical protein